MRHQDGGWGALGQVPMPRGVGTFWGARPTQLIVSPSQSTYPMALCQSTTLVSVNNMLLYSCQAVVPLKSQFFPPTVHRLAGHYMQISTAAPNTDAKHQTKPAGGASDCDMTCSKHNVCWVTQDRTLTGYYTAAFLWL
jgi:hypothetical protein